MDRVDYKVVKFIMVVFGSINNDKDPPVHLNTAVKNTFSNITSDLVIKVEQ